MELKNRADDMYMQAADLALQAMSVADDELHNKLKQLNSAMVDYADYVVKNDFDLLNLICNGDIKNQIDSDEFKDLETWRFNKKDNGRTEKENGK